MNPEVCDDDDTEYVDGVVAVFRVVQALLVAEGPVGARDEPRQLEHEVKRHHEHHHVVHASGNLKMKSYYKLHYLQYIDFPKNELGFHLNI